MGDLNIENNSNKGNLIIISAPSGAGKTTLCNAVREKFPDIMYSISYTTRSPRAGEQNEVDYFFVTKEEFKEGIKKSIWAEWAEVHGNYYGTSAEFINSSIASGNDILLDIDVQGAIRILENYPESLTFFIMPPSIDILKERLESRGSESKEDLKRRLKNAEEEISKKDLYRHIIINDELTAAIDELVSIIGKYR
ncbi:MAG: guanylate kinase [Desulfobacterales bacterium]|jgi:guanylate kinase|nr:guanylate kinase [Desulfobacteraceae bacterium]MBT7086836.1 guanylate kinase [Desulfobacterales bacterium]MBT7698636.1 guanylate kinase [Desulfobacterales bacterium]